MDLRVQQCQLGVCSACSCVRSVGPLDGRPNGASRLYWIISFYTTVSDQLISEQELDHLVESPNCAVGREEPTGQIDPWIRRVALGRTNSSSALQSLIPPTPPRRYARAVLSGKLCPSTNCQAFDFEPSMLDCPVSQNNDLAEGRATKPHRRTPKGLSCCEYED